MAIDFSQFSTKTSALATDYLVGYDQIASGGEKKFTLSTIANTVTRKYDIGGSNTAFGPNAMASNTIGIWNTAVGWGALSGNISANYNTACGGYALQYNTTGLDNVAAGYGALRNNVTGNRNTAVGTNSLYTNVSGFGNTAVGHSSLYDNVSGYSNVAIGFEALRKNNGYNNTACGNATLNDNETGTNNTAIGQIALQLNTIGDYNTAVGSGSLKINTIGEYNTAVGVNALSLNQTYNNVTGIGYNAQVEGSNEIQLGSGTTTCYTYGSVQNRSDIRDKADIRDTELGLEFVNALRPVDFKWDMREDYRPDAPKIVFKPRKLKEDASDEEKAKYAEELAAYNAYKIELDKWLEDVKLANITRNGSKKRIRYHHGLIAQEVKSVLDAKGIDFGGFQDHTINGGGDVMSIGYTELIAPLIKAVQELSTELTSVKAELAKLK